MKTLSTLIIGLALAASVSAQSFNYVTNYTRTITKSTTQQIGSKVVWVTFTTNTVPHVTLAPTIVPAAQFEAGVAAAQAQGIDASGIGSTNTKSFTLSWRADLSLYQFDVIPFAPTTATAGFVPTKKTLMLTTDTVQGFALYFANTNTLPPVTNWLMGARGDNLANTTNSTTGFSVLPRIK